MQDPMVTGIALDSREVKSGHAFLAIRGANVDGHQFANRALELGASLVVCEDPVEGNHIRVGNLVEALANLGRTLRRSFKGPVVGITGSAGKTTAKEFVASALGELGPVLKTEGNRNTEYTAPLMWLEMTPQHRAAVVEMGMRGFGQIQHLASVAEPTVGLITNIGYAHLDLVGSRLGIVQAKSELLGSLGPSGRSILWQEDEFLESLKAKAPGPISTFGFTEGSDCQITDYGAVSWERSEVAGILDGQLWHCTLPMAGRHFALSAAAAVLIASSLGIDAQAAADRCSGVTLPPMRMEVRVLEGKTCILDNYNASPPSMLAALETLAGLTKKEDRYLMLGDMRELGPESDRAHLQAVSAASEFGFARALFFGPLMRGAKPDTPIDGAQWSESLDEARAFWHEIPKGATVLIKGSRALELERIIATAEASL